MRTTLLRIFLFCILSFSLKVTAEPQMVQNQHSPSPVAVQWANRGVELAKQGDFPAAIEALYEAWKLSPEKTNSFAQNLSSAYNNYAGQLAKQRRLDEALISLRKAVFFQETNQTARQNLDAVINQKGMSPENLDTRLKIAHDLRGEGRLEEAVAEYLKVLDLGLQKKHKNHYQHKLELAQVYQVIFSKYAATPSKVSRFYKMSQLVQELLRQNPKDHKPYILLGQAHLANENLPSAIESFEKALDLKPHDELALGQLVKAWEEVVKIAPGEAVNLVGLSNALIRAGRSQEAQQFIQRAKTLDPNNKELQGLIGEAKEIEKEAELARVAERAFEAQTQGHYDQAIDLYKLVLQKLPPGPDNSSLYYNLGLAYKAKGETAEALKNYKQALKFDPSNQKAKQAIEVINKEATATRLKNLNRAVELQEKGELAQAIIVYQQILQADPDNAQAHFNLGTAYQEQGKYQEALAQYKKAAKLAPGKTEFSEAVKGLEDAMNSGALEQMQATSLLEEALTYQQNGNLSGAIAKYNAALQLDPENAQIHFNLATAYHGQNKLAEAIREYKAAYTFDPANYPETNYFVGNLLEAQNKKQEAVIYYKRYLEDAPQAEYASKAAERIKLLE